MTELWLLEDLEPFPDRPVVGDDFAPTTFWVDAGSDYRTEPTGSVRLLSRSRLVQRRRLIPTEHPAFFTPEYSGPLRLVDGVSAPDDHDIRLGALRVRIPLAPPAGP